MANKRAPYAVSRRVKAMRTADATFSAVGPGRTHPFSLISGVEKRGWDIGMDGTASRMIDASSAADVLGQLSLNEVVYACLRTRQDAIISPRFLVERKQADGTYQEEPEHALAALIRRPGENLDTATFWRCLEASYASVGRMYLEPERGTLTGSVYHVNPLNPAWVHEHVVQGELLWYDWQPPEAPPVRFGPNELIVRRAVGWADVPPLVAALGAVEADELSSTFLRTFFSNGGVPSGIVKIREAWDEDKAIAFRSAWMQRFGPNTTTPGAPALLFPPVESYERIGVGVSDLDTETLKMFVETRICMTMGVPPLIIYAYAGLLKATYSNLSEAWESFWDSTALNLLRSWADWCTWSLLTLYEDRNDVLLGNVRCRFDPTGLGPYQEDVDAKVAQYLAGYQAGTVKLNEYRSVLGLPPEANGDVFKADRAPEPAAMLEIPARQEVTDG